MQIIVQDHYEDARHTIEGSEDDVRHQLLELYPHLLVKYGNSCDIRILVKALNSSQFATAVILDDFNKAEAFNVGVDGQGLHMVRYDHRVKHGQIHTQDDQIAICREAAAFLAGHPCEDKEMRQALLQCDGDPELAALQAHGLPATSLPDLRAVLSSVLKKSEDPDEDKPVTFKDVSAATESGKTFAKMVQEASGAGEIKHIKLGAGKHNHGMLIARDAKTHESYVLKPGSGKQNPVVGETESGSTQSQREACFYAIAQAWGLGDCMPECHLLLIDGREYACMKFLPHTYKNMNDLKDHDPGLPKRLLSLYNDGTLHKWATLDYVLGNADRHAGNLMASGDSVKLIDHGSSFAGISFDPAKDGMSFVPYYLRPSVSGFAKMSTNDKLRNLPRLNAENEAKFKEWLLKLSPSVLTQVMTIYGIDSSPEVKRLEQLQMSTGYQSADLAVLSAWVVG